MTQHLDAEQEVAERAAQVLVEIGPFAAGPMAAVLGRSRSLQQKVPIIRLLVDLGPQARLTAGRAIVYVLKREKYPFVRRYAAAAQTELIIRDIRGRTDPVRRP